jgi:hypothetical protein
VSGHYILGRPKGTSAACFVLDLDPRTKADAEQAIRWQHEPRGSSDYEWHVCRIEKGQFKNAAGETLSVRQSPYTTEVWEAFLAARVKSAT